MSSASRPLSGRGELVLRLARQTHTPASWREVRRELLTLAIRNGGRLIRPLTDGGYLLGQDAERMLELVESKMDVSGRKQLLGDALENAALLGEADLVDRLLQSGALFGKCFDKAAAGFKWRSLLVALKHLVALPPPGRGGMLTKSLQIAAGAGEFDVVVALMRAGATVGTALHAAARNCRPTIIAAILNSVGAVGVPAALDNRDSEGRAPLHVAICTPCITLLVSRGAKINALGGDIGGGERATPLYSAVVFDRPKVAKLLIKLGADVNRRRRDGIDAKTPLHAAARAGKEVIMRALLEHQECVIDPSDRDGCTPLHFAAGQPCDRGCVSALLRVGARVNWINDKGETPLIAAAAHCNVTAVSDLLWRGADELMCERKGLSAADICGRRARGPLVPERVHNIRHMLKKAPRDRAWRRRKPMMTARLLYTDCFFGGGSGSSKKGIGAGGFVKSSVYKHLCIGGGDGLRSCGDGGGSSRKGKGKRKWHADGGGNMFLLWAAKKSPDDVFRCITGYL